MKYNHFHDTKLTACFFFIDFYEIVSLKAFLYYSYAFKWISNALFLFYKLIFIPF